MKLTSTVKDKNIKCWIVKILGKGKDFPWETKFINRKWISQNKDNAVAEFEITERGIYQCHKVDGVNPERFFEDGKVFAYIDPNFIMTDEDGNEQKGFGDRIKSTSIENILKELKDNNEIDIFNLTKYEK